MLALIKRKVKEAIGLLSEVIDNNSVKPYYKGMACIYRAYAHIISHSFDVTWHEK